VTSFHYCSLCAHTWRAETVDQERRGVLRPCPTCAALRATALVELKAAA
jgi:hypothetical protein